MDAAADRLKTEAADSLRAEARRRASTICRTAAERGDFLWEVGDRRFNLGLFRGIAGVGYALTRLLDPTVPNILTWD